jgi:hypothetical protein
MPPLDVDFGPPGPFPCPWCALPFTTRALLDEHWRLNPECAANRAVNNPTQSKLLDRRPMTLKPRMPGEDVLAKVAAATRCACCGNPDPNHDRAACEAGSAAGERQAQRAGEGI